MPDALPNESKVIARAHAYERARDAWRQVEREWENPHTASLDDRLPGALAGLLGAAVELRAAHDDVRSRRPTVPRGNLTSGEHLPGCKVVHGPDLLREGLEQHPDGAYADFVRRQIEKSEGTYYQVCAAGCPTYEGKMARARAKAAERGWI